MVFAQVIAGFRVLLNAIGLPMNLLVIVTIVLERRFYVMRYILLASLAVSDFLFLALANSFLIGTTAQERWIYGQTMCYLNPCFVLYFYLNTVLHLIAISYERYSAIVKSPMTYDGTITKSRVVLIILIWAAPIPLSILPFVGLGQYVYNPEVFSCEQMAVNPENAARNTIVFAFLTLVAPSLIIVFLNWSVFKTAQTLHHNVVQVGNYDGSGTSENQLEEMSRRRIEQKAAVDVCIIAATFMVCFLPAWIVGICRQFLKNLDVPAKLVLGTNAVFHASALCNPFIYSIRKRDFRAGVRNVFRRMGVDCGSFDYADNNQIDMNNITARANIGTRECTAGPAAPQAAQNQAERFYHGSTGRSKINLQGGRLSPIQEIAE